MKVMLGTMRFEDTGLLNLLKALEHGHSVKVGVFGGKPHDKRGKGSDVTMADVGFVNEFGSVTRHIPARSWLRMPIMDYINEIYMSAKEEVGTWVELADARHFLEKVGASAVAFILAAFESRGGTLHEPWKPNKPATIRRKGSDSPLIDTGALRRAVTFKVE